LIALDPRLIGDPAPPQKKKTVRWLADLVQAPPNPSFFYLEKPYYSTCCWVVVVVCPSQLSANYRMWLKASTPSSFLRRISPFASFRPRSLVLLSHGSSLFWQVELTFLFTVDDFLAVVFGLAILGYATPASIFFSTFHMLAQFFPHSTPSFPVSVSASSLLCFLASPRLTCILFIFCYLDLISLFFGFLLRFN
jgi:hypothetical protein